MLKKNLEVYTSHIALDFTGDIALNVKNANNFWGRHRRDVATAVPGTACQKCRDCLEECEELREEHAHT